MTGAIVDLCDWCIVELCHWWRCLQLGDLKAAVAHAKTVLRRCAAEVKARLAQPKERAAVIAVALYNLGATLEAATMHTLHEAGVPPAVIGWCYDSATEVAARDLGVHHPVYHALRNPIMTSESSGGRTQPAPASQYGSRHGGTSTAEAAAIGHGLLAAGRLATMGGSVGEGPTVRPHTAPLQHAAAQYAAPLRDWQPPPRRQPRRELLGKSVLGQLVNGSTFSIGWPHFTLIELAETQRARWGAVVVPVVLPLTRDARANSERIAAVQRQLRHTGKHGFAFSTTGAPSSGHRPPSASTLVGSTALPAGPDAMALRDLPLHGVPR